MGASMTFKGFMATAEQQARSTGKTIHAWALRTPPWKVGLTLAAAGVGLAILFPLLAGVLMFALVGAVVLGWVREFVFLMRTPASAFPGRHDRWVWLTVMILLAPLAWLAYWTFRHAEWEDGVPWRVERPSKSGGSWDAEGYF